MPPGPPAESLADRYSSLVAEPPGAHSGELPEKGY